MKHEYSYSDYDILLSALKNAEEVCRPDEYQMRQNYLAQEIAYFLLKPWLAEQELANMKMSLPSNEEKN